MFWNIMIKFFFCGYIDILKWGSWGICKLKDVVLFIKGDRVFLILDE